MPYIIKGMMKNKFRNCLNDLGLTQLEAARLLQVNARTVRRWAENSEEIPGPANQALHAWQRLKKLGLPWRPDGSEFPGDTSEQIASDIAKSRAHAIGLDKLLSKVRKRGGPMVPWEVDLKANQAILGTMRLWFYRLPDGGFSPAGYTRIDTDERLDWEHDGPLIEDGFACIAEAIATDRRRKSKS